MFDRMIRLTLAIVFVCVGALAVLSVGAGDGGSLGAVVWVAIGCMAGIGLLLADIASNVGRLADAERQRRREADPDRRATPYQQWEEARRRAAASKAAYEEQQRAEMNAEYAEQERRRAKPAAKPPPVPGEKPPVRR